MKRYSRAYTTVSIIMYVQPVVFVSSTIFLQSSMLVAMGTVHATCLPAFSALIDCGSHGREWAC